jgi:hypothetical protein
MEPEPKRYRVSVEDVVKIGRLVRIDRSRFLLLCLASLLFIVNNVALAQQPPPPQQPADVAGNWTIYAHDPEGGTSTKYVELKQNGTVITGHFKGPNQSGGLEGTINEQHIVFRTKTRYVLTFRGRVEGNRVQGRVEGTSITGTFHTRNGTGQWQASRPNSATGNPPD